MMIIRIQQPRNKDLSTRFTRWISFANVIDNLDKLLKTTQPTHF